MEINLWREIRLQQINFMTTEYHYTEIISELEYDCIRGARLVHNGFEHNLNEKIDTRSVIQIYWWVFRLSLGFSIIPIFTTRTVILPAFVAHYFADRTWSHSNENESILTTTNKKNINMVEIFYLYGLILLINQIYRNEALRRSEKHIH